MIAGMVTPSPKAIDSPAEPAGLNDVVLKNRGVSSAELGHIRNSAREITATGIEALTVMPTFKTR